MLLLLPGAERHRLSCSCCLIQQRCVRDVKRSHVADHRLEVEKTLQSSLRHFRLVRSVLGVPERITIQQCML